MKKFIVALALIAATAFPAAAATWAIDADHTVVGFKIRHMMISNVKGNFEKVQGTLDLNDADITKSKVEVSIDTKSINTNVAKRDDHLRSSDFFDVAKYPTMTFTSKKVAAAGKGKLKVTGDLTLHGVTRSVVLDVEGPSVESKDPWGNVRRGFSATTKINRKDYGLNWNAVLESGGVLVGEEVTIDLDIQLIKK